MGNRTMPALLLAGIIILSFVSAGLVVAPNESGVQVPAELRAKFDRAMVRELEAGDSPTVDAIVACERGVYSRQAEMIREAIGGFRIIQEYSRFSVFRAELTKRQACDIARLPFVTRIDNNSRSIHAYMDTASYYTHVTFMRDLHPEWDGNLAGAAKIYSKDDVVICIIDTGIDPDHVDLNAGKIIGWVDLVGHHEYIYDNNGHGTRVASIAAGTGEGNPNYMGVARGAALVIVKALDINGEADEATCVEALDWVAQHQAEYGIEIVSISWGASPGGQYDVLAQMADQLAGTMVVVACQGNKYQGADRVVSPGTGKYVITVGAAADPGEGGWCKASFSLPGPCDDGRTKPDVLAPGVNIMCAKRYSTDEYMEASGTSYSTPFVSGLVALWLDYDMSLLSHEPNDGNPKVKYILTGSATDVPGDTIPGKDNYWGAGRVDMFDNWLFVDNDVSTGFSDARQVLDYSWYDQSYTESNEGLWPYDEAWPSYGDYYKLNAYSGIFIYVQAWGDPDLLLKIRLYDRYQNLLCQSYTGNDRNLSWTAAYSGVYYVRITAESLTADWYDVTISTTPS